jgi:hypothetical protein
MIEAFPIEPPVENLDEGSDQEGDDLENEGTMTISLKTEANMKSKLLKFEEIVKLRQRS